MDKNLKKDLQNKIKVALYVRVSTQEQAKEGYSIGEQEERLRKYADAMCWNIYKIYVDPGYSGGNMNRPGLQSLIKDVEDRLVDKVVVYKLDRLSRSQKDTLILIEDVFLTHNVDFVSMSESFDTATPVGRAVLGLLAVFAQLERDQIKERMGIGREARAKSGKWGGGAIEPVGFNYDASRDLLIKNDYEIIQYLEAVDLFLKGTPIRTIERIFLEKGYKHKYGPWSVVTLKAVLKSKLYLGYIHYHDEWYPAEHDAVITQETYDKIQKIFAQRAEDFKAFRRKGGRVTCYLAGLLLCKKCGARYSKQENCRRRKGKEIVYAYMCNSRNKKTKNMIKDPNCKNKNWKMEELDEIVFNEIRKLAIDPEYIRTLRREEKKNATDTPNKIQIIENEIEKINDQISRFMDLYGIGKFTIDQVSSKIDPLNESRSRLEKELNSLNAEAGRLSEEEAIELVTSFEDIIEGGDFDEIRQLLTSLIYYIELDEDDVYIHWKFI